MSPLPWLNWQGHGLPRATIRKALSFTLNPWQIPRFPGQNIAGKGIGTGYRYCPKQAGIELKIAAKIDRVDQAYFNSVIKPLLEGPGVEFVGEISDPRKASSWGELWRC